MNTRTRAPKGGQTFKGVFYKGGQFLPTNEPQRGKWNSNKTTSRKVRKVEVAPYVWVENPDNKQSLYSQLNGTRGRWNFDTKTFSPNTNATVLNYLGTTVQEVQELCNRYNAGEHWL